MNGFKNISVDNFNYDLPIERIAAFPLDDRDKSALLIYNEGQISKDIFKNCPDYLPDDSLIVFNNTKVVQAKLLFQKDTGALIEVFCMEPYGPVKDLQQAFEQKGRASWFCLVGNAKKWKRGPLIFFGKDGLLLKATKRDSINEGFVIDFEWISPELTFADVLNEAGNTPLPPYIHRKAVMADRERYQTIFALHPGSIAAPTAGLHFTDYVLDQLNKKGIATAFLTLHVGAGTFKPVTAKTIEEHNMHTEQILITKETVEKLIDFCDKKIISVGTTSLRSLESLYWAGVKIGEGYKPEGNLFCISQWEPYERENKKEITVKDSLSMVLSFMIENNYPLLRGNTGLIIVPGYKIRMADMLITNFHLPKSTLLLLVAAFCGDDWRKIYSYALDKEFRFLSYGDSSLLIKNREFK